RGRAGDGPSPGADICTMRPDLLWLDAIAQQGLSALCLSRIAALLGRDGEAGSWHAKWTAIRDETNALYWDEADGLYYDIRESDHSKARVPTIASFWPLLAEMPTPDMAQRLLAKLNDPFAFGC
ncbi:MAG: neutral trehalase, partial [Kiritimatiellae bacterium]|nr:neutral trehalase [Kiritimatiellia bacterium]